MLAKKQKSESQPRDEGLNWRRKQTSSTSTEFSCCCRLKISFLSLFILFFFSYFFTFRFRLPLHVITSIVSPFICLFSYESTASSVYNKREIACSAIGRFFYSTSHWRLAHWNRTKYISARWIWLLSSKEVSPHFINNSIDDYDEGFRSSGFLFTSTAS